MKIISLQNNIINKREMYKIIFSLLSVSLIGCSNYQQSNSYYSEDSAFVDTTEYEPVEVKEETKFVDCENFLENTTYIYYGYNPERGVAELDYRYTPPELTTLNCIKAKVNLSKGTVIITTDVVQTHKISNIKCYKTISKWGESQPCAEINTDKGVVRISKPDFNFPARYHEYSIYVEYGNFKAGSKLVMESLKEESIQN